MSFSSKVLFAFLLTLGASNGLKCYTCDNNGMGADCITDPEGLGSTPCQTPNDEYCFTSRLEEAGNKITLNRGCCRIKEGSTVCPTGTPAFDKIVNESPPYVLYLTRCSGDLCNDSDGNGNGGSGNGGDGGGNIIVGGNNNGNKELRMQWLVLMVSLMFVMASCT